MVKTTQKSIVAAYMTIDKLSNTAFSLPLSYKLFRVKKSLSPHFEFQKEQEKMFAALFNAELKQGMWSFPSEVERDGFVQKLKELNELIIEVDLEKAQILLSEDVLLSVADMEALSDFFDFS